MRQRKSADELLVGSLYRYVCTARSQLNIYKTKKNLLGRVYHLDFTPVGVVGKLSRNDVLMVVELPSLIDICTLQLDDMSPPRLCKSYAIKILSGERLGWISVLELETPFEELLQGVEENG